MAKKTIVLTSLGIISFFSLFFSIGLVIGYITGNYFSKKILEGKTRLKPLIFHIKSWKIHLHHWFLSVMTVLSVVVLGYFTHFPEIIYGVLGGLIFQDIYWDRKWYKILSKRT